MYIFCPNCNAEFIISDDLIQPIGKKLKCFECRHVWRQYPDKPQASKKIHNLPAVVPNSYLKILLYFTSSTLLFFLGISLLFLFKAATLQQSKDLSLEAFKINQSIDQQELSIYYKITNNSDSIRQVPFVKIRLLSSDAKIIESRIFDHQISILPGEYALIGYEFQGLSDSADNVDVVIGTKLGLILSEFK